MKEAYQALYRLVGADLEDYCVFTSSGAEAVNHLILSTYIDVTRRSGRHHFLASAIAEAPTIMAMTRLEEDLGCHFQTVSALGGAVTKESVAEMITPRTALLSLSWADGLTGVIQPIEAIAELCAERDIFLHVDATHVLGKGHFSFRESGAHFLTFDGEQIGGPKGSGALFVRKGVDLSPLILGGHENDPMRGGALNLPALIALGEAAQKAIDLTDHFCMESARHHAAFEAHIAAQLPDAEILFRDRPRLPATSAILFPPVVSDALLYYLRNQKVRATMGGGYLQQIGHLLKACGVEEPLYHCGLSFTMGSQVEAEQVIRAVKQLKRYGEYLDVFE